MPPTPFFEKNIIIKGVFVVVTTYYFLLGMSISYPSFLICRALHGAASPHQKNPLVQFLSKTRLLKVTFCVNFYISL